VCVCVCVRPFNLLYRLTVLFIVRAIQVKEVALRSGDVLVFGGNSRDILHQVSAIEPATSNTNSDSNSTVVHNMLGSIGGRFNINFREL
jgi:2OG-Fe(II) oxygenase superfamily